MGAKKARRTGWRAKFRPGRSSLAVLAATFTVPFLAPAAQAQAGRAALADPLANVPRTAAMESACGSGPAPDCQQVVLQAIDRARAAEGVGPLGLPANYDELSISQQILVLTDLERVDRHLPGFSGLSSQLDTLAQTGARSNNDPAGPSGTDWGSNWAGGEGSALLADYDWMYDDGPRSPNVDCTSPAAEGCWAHRRNILGDYGQHPSMGAGSTRVNGVTSMTQLFSSAPAGQLDYALPHETPGLVTPLSLQIGPGHGYWEATSRGSIFAYAGGGFRGSAGTLDLAQPVVGMAATANGGGYWEVAADGGVFSYGNAKFFGSAAHLHLTQPVVGLAVAGGGRGYWLVTRNGNIYSFGDARFYGTPAGQAGEDVVAMAATPDGLGYWLVTSQGIIYSFGDARFYGPKADMDHGGPVVGMAVTHNGRGYWLVTENGRVYSFGDASYHGSVATGGDERVVGIAVPSVGPGYYLAQSNGTVLSFGGASFARSGAGSHPRNPVVAMATA
jgi:hypothetical protein